ncbi:MAG: hypothetical protein AB1611_00555 [bacterium]
MNRDFSGFDDWVPIFAGGKQIDSQGAEHEGDELIDKAIRLFDPEYHEPPITVGHPHDNSPAFGWVKALRKVTRKLNDGSKVNVLMAKFKDVVPEFAQAVRQGLYKKRSASFYPDGRLRHVGFLGGMPPAVKGLADLKFGEGEHCMLFSDALGAENSEEDDNGHHPHPVSPLKGEENSEGSLLTGDGEGSQVRWGTSEEGSSASTGENAGAAPALSESSTQQREDENFTQHKEGQNMSYTEEQMQALLDQQRERITAEFEEKLQKSIGEFTERLNQISDETARKIEEAREEGRKEATADFAEQRRKDGEAARRKEIREFITTGIQFGHILPAWEKLGLAQFMESLGTDQNFNFAEGKKETPYQWFRNFLSELPRTVNFGEFATRAKNIAASGNAGQQLNDLVAGKMKENPKLDYMAAFSEVQRENPDLVREYEQEIHLAR